MMNFPLAIVLSLLTVLMSTVEGIYLTRFRASITEMLGMMLGMTEGMMTGIAVGYFVGAATDMFIGNLVGLAVGMIFGIVFGRAGGLMGMMDGGMGGLMGGMMGAMLGVMLQYLYDGWAVGVTAGVVAAVYVVSMIALVRLVQKTAGKRLAIDPVCNMEVDPETALQHTHQGMTYYFCAPSCKRAFIKEPERYIRLPVAA